MSYILYIAFSLYRKKISFKHFRLYSCQKDSDKGFKVNLNVNSRKKRTFVKDFNFFTQALPPPPLTVKFSYNFLILFK